MSQLTDITWRPEILHYSYTNVKSITGCTMERNWHNKEVSINVLKVPGDVPTCRVCLEHEQEILISWCTEEKQWFSYGTNY